MRPKTAQEMEQFFRSHCVEMDWYVQGYSNALTIPIERGVNAISIKNASTTAVLIVESDPLQPGDTKSIGGHPLAIIRHRHLNISFTGAGPFLAIVTQFYFVDYAKVEMLQQRGSVSSLV